MTETMLLDLAQEGLYLALLLSLPAVVAALLVGLVVGLFQAATRLQEQTLSVVPRLVAVFAVLLLAGGWMGAQLLRYTAGLWHLLGDIQL